MELKAMITEMINIAKQELEVDVNPEELMELMGLANIKMFRKGDMIQKIGENNHFTGYVLKGIIRSYYLDEDGNENTKNFHIEHSLFMDEGLVNYEISICAFEALEDCTVIFFPTKELKSKIMESETLKSLYMAALESGLRYKLQRENKFLTCNGTERYLWFKENYPKLEDRVKQSYIATYLGITPESLSRIRRSLKEE